MQKPLETAQRTMSWHCMCPADESSIARHKMAYIAYTFVIFICTVNGIITTFAYCLKFISINFDGAAFAFMVCVGELVVFYTFIVAILMQHRIGDLFVNLSTIYQNSKFNHSLNI